MRDFISKMFDNDLSKKFHSFSSVEHPIYYEYKIYVIIIWRYHVWRLPFYVDEIIRSYPLIRYGQGKEVINWILYRDRFTI